MASSAKERVAIIGGGVSGISCAYLLKKKGYKDVTIVEKGSKVGGVIQSIRVRGKVYDKAAMFVPGSGLSGPGIETLLEEMIQFSGEKLVPALDFAAYDAQNSTVEVLPDILKKYSPEALQDQLVRGLSYHTAYIRCFQEGLSCGECSLCDSTNPSESLHEWGARLGVPAYSDLVVYVVDGLGGGPLSFSPAGRVLLVTSFWSPAEVIRVLDFLEFSPTDLPDGTLPNVIALLSQTPQRWWFFKRGYQKFLAKVVRKLRIRVRLRTTVDELKFMPALKKWKLRTNRGSRLFDQVIVTTPPQATLSFLFEGAQKELISSAIPIAPPNDVFVVRVSGYADAGLEEIEAFWPNGLGLGSPSLVDSSVGGVVKPTFWQKRFEQDILIVGTYTLSAEVSPEQALNACKNYASTVLGFEITGVLAHNRYFYPPSPRDVAAWLQGWDTLQGENGLYFFGEAFAGSGVPAITNSAARFIAQNFPLTQ